MAILLGRLQMSVDDCIKVYADMSDKIFTKQKHRINIRGTIQARFDTAALEAAIKEAVRRQNVSVDEKLFSRDPAQCKVYLPSIHVEPCRRWEPLSHQQSSS